MRSCIQKKMDTVGQYFRIRDELTYSEVIKGIHMRQNVVVWHVRTKHENPWDVRETPTIFLILTKPS